MGVSSVSILAVCLTHVRVIVPDRSVVSPGIIGGDAGPVTLVTALDEEHGLVRHRHGHTVAGVVRVDDPPWTVDILLLSVRDIGESLLGHEGLLSMNSYHRSLVPK